jgi:hypothetical protein
MLLRSVPVGETKYIGAVLTATPEKMTPLAPASRAGFPVAVSSIDPSDNDRVPVAR